MSLIKRTCLTMAGLLIAGCGIEPEIYKPELYDAAAKDMMRMPAGSHALIPRLDEGDIRYDLVIRREESPNQADKTKKYCADFRVAMARKNQQGQIELRYSGLVGNRRNVPLTRYYALANTQPETLLQIPQEVEVSTGFGGISYKIALVAETFTKCEIRP